MRIGTMQFDAACWAMSEFCKRERRAMAQARREEERRRQDARKAARQDKARTRAGATQ